MGLFFFGLRGRSAVFAVALIDVAVGFLTGIGSLIGLLYSASWNFDFSGLTTPDLVKSLGLLSILVVAVAEVWSGCKLFSGLCQRKPAKLYFWKLFVYLIPEVVGFVAPFYFVPNYTGIIDELMANQKSLFVLYLLKVNVLTILLFIFQIYSFLLVRNYGRSKNKKLGKLKCAFRDLERARTNLEIPLVPLGSSRSTRQGDTNALYVASGGSSHFAPKHSLYPSLVDFDTPQDALAQVIVHSGGKRLNIARGSKIGTSFYEIQKMCVKSGILFVDPEFPIESAASGSISEGVQWKRPREIHPNPQFITNGVSRFDVVQGELGDCWFLAALANLTLHERLFYQVVPEDNVTSFGSNYAGIFHFRFNEEGTWKDVVIDDRLPTRRGKLIYASSPDRQEFWSCLLEKAYAKFKGSYDELIGGLPGTAMKDFTGKPIMKFDYTREPPQISDLFKLLTDALLSKKLVSAGMFRNDGINLKRGLPGGHAYSVTGVKEIHLQRRAQKVRLVRI